MREICSVSKRAFQPSSRVPVTHFSRRADRDSHVFDSRTQYQSAMRARSDIRRTLFHRGQDMQERYIHSPNHHKHENTSKIIFMQKKKKKTITGFRFPFPSLPILPLLSPLHSCLPLPQRLRESPRNTPTTIPGSTSIDSTPTIPAIPRRVGRRLPARGPLSWGRGGLWLAVCRARRRGWGRWWSGGFDFLEVRGGRPA